MMHFEGTETFHGEPAEVFRRLADAAWVARSLPEAERVLGTADQASWRVRPKFAFMAGTLDTTAIVSYRTPDRAVRFRVQSQGIGSHSLMEITLMIRPEKHHGSIVQWTAELVELGGLLARVPKAMVQAAALKTIADVWQAVRPELDGNIPQPG